MPGTLMFRRYEPPKALYDFHSGSLLTEKQRPDLADERFRLDHSGGLVRRVENELPHTASRDHAREDRLVALGEPAPDLLFQSG